MALLFLEVLVLGGVEGKILAIEFCRENKIPILGLCYGLQLMTVEFARNVCGLKGAHTTEVNPKTKYPVIDILQEQKKFLKEKLYGGTMRLGDWKCEIKKGTIYRGYTQMLTRIYADENTRIKQIISAKIRVVIIRENPRIRIYPW
jgi:CTP synthase (UTP-ammonia lyase)